MNCDKTEHIVFGSQQQLSKLKSHTIMAVDKCIIRSKHLGAFLDVTLSFEEHVTNICKKLAS